MSISPLAQGIYHLIKSLEGNTQRPLIVANHKGAIQQDTFEHIMQSNLCSGENSLTKTLGIGVFRAYYIRLKAYMFGIQEASALLVNKLLSSFGGERAGNSCACDTNEDEPFNLELGMNAYALSDSML